MLASVLVRNTEVSKGMLVEDQVGAVSKVCLLSAQTLLPSGYVVVLDIAGMHALNHELGMSVVDKRLRCAHINVEDAVIKLAGDEYCVVVSTHIEASAIALRLSQLYSGQGISAYFEIESYNGNIKDAVNTGLDRIMLRKAKRDASFVKRLIRAWGIIVKNGAR